MKTRIYISISVFCITFIVYIVTLAPTVTFHDSGELITASYTLGIAHSPGAPLYCLIGKLFTLIPYGSVAWRVNCMSAFFGSACCALLYLLCSLQGCFRRLTQKGLAYHLTLAACACAFGFSLSFWEESVVAEQYTLNLLFIALLALCGLLWRQLAILQRANAGVWISCLALFLGLGAANHMSVFFVMPVLLIAFLFNSRLYVWNIRSLILPCLLFCLGLALYIYLPLRSLADPYMDWGNPQTLENFWFVFLRKQWGPLSLSNISWSFVREWLIQFDLVGEFGWPFVVAGVIGMVAMLRTHTKAGLYWVGMGVCFGVCMLFSQAATAPLTYSYVANYGTGEFNIPCFFIFAIFASYGVLWFAEFIGNRIRASRRKAAMGSVVLVLLGVGLCGSVFVVNYAACDYRGFTAAHDYGLQILASLPKNAIYIAGRDDDAFIFYYLQGVEGQRRDVAIVTPSQVFWNNLKRQHHANPIAIPKQIILERMRQYGKTELFPVVNNPDTGQLTHDRPLCWGIPVDNLVLHTCVPRGMVFEITDTFLQVVPADVLESHYRFWQQTSLSLAGSGFEKHDVRDAYFFTFIKFANYFYVMKHFPWAHYFYERAFEVAPAVHDERLIWLYHQSAAKIKGLDL